MIIESTERIFARDGYIVSMDVIAECAGVSRQTIYNYFGSKKGLLAATISHVSNQILSLILPEIDRSLDLETALLEWGRRCVKGSLRGLDIVVLAITSRNSNPKLGWDLHRSLTLKSQAILAGYLRDKSEEGIIVDIDPSVAAEIFISSVTGLIRSMSLYGHAPRFADRLEYIETAVALFVRGISRGS